jgi:ABC-type branched-subunit amino acid transport system ATPase component
MESNLTPLPDIVVGEKVILIQPQRQPILEIRNLSMAFKKLMAVNEVSFTVLHGDITAIIGPNGAGKTTLSKLTTGLLKPLSGEIWFKQQKINKLLPHNIATLGIAQVFQDIKLFENMSVIENVMVGCHVWTRSGFLGAGIRERHARMEEETIRATALEKLCLVGLQEKANDNPSSLSWGQQRLAGVARALAANPKLLFLDEPYGGLRSNEIEKLSQLVLKLQKQGLTIIIVDHLLDCIMSIANRVIFLVDGEKIAEGTPLEIEQNELIRYTYTGNAVSKVSKRKKSEK